MIAGQYEWYIESQVKAIQAKERWNENAKKMFPFVKKLKDQDIKDLAAYIRSMKLKK
jgi:cytochrome c553